MDELAFFGKLKKRDGTLIRGEATLHDTGIIIDGRADPKRHEVVGLPYRTIFVPYANVDEFEFTEVPE